MKYLKQLGLIVFPGRCPVCDKAVPPGKLICNKCDKKLIPVKEPKCMKCGKQMWQEGQYCYDCERKHFTYERGFALYNYNEVTRKSIASFKYKGRAEYAVFYGQEMAKRYRDIMKRYHINAVLPVPVHHKRLKQRGYNQAGLLAKKLCEQTGMINLDGLIVRVKNTLPQKELDDVERRRNIEKAFEINPSFVIPKGVKNVLIVDDIYTTGTTIEACSRIIKKVMGRKVFFLVLAIGRGL